MELARRQAALIALEDENGRRSAEGKAAAADIAAEAEARRMRVTEAARTAGEGDRLALLRDVDPAVLQVLTLRAFAEKLTRIETLNVTPDLTAALGAMLRAAPVPASTPPPAPTRGGGPAQT